VRNLIVGVLAGIAISPLVAQQRSEAIPNAVVADPAHYSVSFENELVRFVRVRYESGAKSVMHSHSANCVIYLTDQTFNFTLPDGTSEPASVPAGALGCSNGNVHLPENISGHAVEFIMVEFKNRSAFRQ